MSFLSKRHVSVKNKYISKTVKSITDTQILNKDNYKFTINNNPVTLDYIGKGAQGMVYKLKLPKCNDIALKISTIHEHEEELLKYHHNLVVTNKCPHFLLIYNIIEARNKNFIFMEKISYNMNKWLKENHTDQEWLSFLFQFLIAIYVMKTYSKTFHGDLKPINIFVLNLTDMYFNVKKYFHYKITINDQVHDYYVPHCYNLCVIGDFGRAKSNLFEYHNENENKDKINPKINDDVTRHLNNNDDLRHIYDIVNIIKVSYITSNYNLRSLVKFMKGRGDEKIGPYVKSQKLRIKTDPRNYESHMRKYMLLKYVADFVIENNYYDKLAYPNMDYKLPSAFIQSIIKNNFNGSKNPEDIILEIFTNYK